MLTLFLLAAAASAQEPACTERIAPQRLTQEIEALRQGLLNGEEAVGERLNALFRNMNECVDGPVERSDIGKLLMARGAFGILTKKVAPEAAQQQMTWAYAISGRDVFDEAYGLEVQEAFDIATEGVLPRATIDSPLTAILVWWSSTVKWSTTEDSAPSRQPTTSFSGSIKTAGTPRRWS